MELRSLRYFVAIAEELHFGRAAERLGIAQPALSQQMQRLEHDLGFKLFDRNRHGVRTTEAGRVLLRDARRILTLAAEAEARASAASRGLTGELTIGFVGGLHFSLPAAVVKLRAQLPAIRISLLELTFDQLMRGLYDDRIDLGFFRQWAPHSTMTVERLGATPLVVAFPQNHPLLDRAQIRASDLGGESFIFFSRTIVPGYAERINSTFAELGIVPNVVQDVFSAQAAFAFVAAGVGIALVPETVRSQARASGVEVRPVIDPVIAPPTVAAWRRDGDVPLRTVVLDALRAFAAAE